MDFDLFLLIFLISLVLITTFIDEKSFPKGKTIVLLNSGLIWYSKKLNKKNNFNLKFIRHYPHSVYVNPPSKFSEDTTEKELNKYNEDHEKKVENIAERDNDLHDDMINAFMEANGDEDKIKEKYEYFDKEIKSRSAKFLEEIKEDHQKIRESVEYSRSFTDETIERELAKLDKQLQEEIQAEGEHTKDLLEQLERERSDALNEMSSLASFGSDNSDLNSNKDEKFEDEKNKTIAKSENNDKKMSESENENKQSPIDYVLEKKDCEMPDVSGSDTGE